MIKFFPFRPTCIEVEPFTLFITNSTRNDEKNPDRKGKKINFEEHPSFAVVRTMSHSFLPLQFGFSSPITK
jgi:hypothetical protein